MFVNFKGSLLTVNCNYHWDKKKLKKEISESQQPKLLFIALISF